MPLQALAQLTLSHTAMSILEAAEQAGRLHLAGSVDELVSLATPDSSLGLGEVGPDGRYVVGYDVPGRGFVPEAHVCQTKNGVAANYVEAYMRRRDPDCMVVGDATHTDKPTYQQRFGKPFGDLRSETIDWLKAQPIAAFFFRTGLPNKPLNAIAIAPANAGFFALGLAMLQGIVPLDEIRAEGAQLPPWCRALRGSAVSPYALRRQTDCCSQSSFRRRPEPTRTVLLQSVSGSFGKKGRVRHAAHAG